MTARSPRAIPRRRAATRNASADGFPSTVPRAPVILEIAPTMAQDVPSARPFAVAKNGASDAAYSLAPDHTASQAASMSSIANSRNQPTKIASISLRSGGRTASSPASSSGPPTPAPPRTITRRWPLRAR